MQRWRRQPLCVLAAEPDEQLGVGLDGLDGVEVDVVVDLARQHVLLLRGERAVHVVHPVAARRVHRQDHLVHLVTLEDLWGRR